MYPFIDWAVINWTALIIASLAGFGLGALWYSPLLFGNIWMEAVGMKGQKMEMGQAMYITMGMTLLVTLVMGFVLTQFIGSGAGAQMGMRAGLLSGIGFSAMTLIMNGIYNQKSANLMAIESLHMIATLALMGTILGYMG